MCWWGREHATAKKASEQQVGLREEAEEPWWMRVGRRGRPRNRTGRSEISTMLAAVVGSGRNHLVWCLYQALLSESHIPDCYLLTSMQYVIKCR